MRAGQSQGLAVDAVQLELWRGFRVAHKADDSVCLLCGDGKSHERGKEKRAASEEKGAPTLQSPQLKNRLHAHYLEEHNAQRLAKRQAGGLFPALVPCRGQTSKLRCRSGLSFPGAALRIGGMPRSRPMRQLALQSAEPFQLGTKLLNHQGDHPPSKWRATSPFPGPTRAPQTCAGAQAVLGKLRGARARKVRSKWGTPDDLADWSTLPAPARRPWRRAPSAWFQRQCAPARRQVRCSAFCV